MNPHRPSRLQSIAAIAVLGALVFLTGCFNPFSPRIAPNRGFSQTAPVPNSPSNLLRLFEWCYRNKAIAEYRELFTDDYRFYFNPLDSAGEAYKQVPWTREDELISTTHLFVGGAADAQAADRIELDLDRNFFVERDPTFAASDPTGRWHKSVLTAIQFMIYTQDDTQPVTGAARFYLVRGDSALIPEELRLRGFAPDSNRWYIRQLDDETTPTETGGGLAAVRMPSLRPVAAATRPGGAVTSDGPRVASWGYVKVLFLGDGRGLARRAPDR